MSPSEGGPGIHHHLAHGDVQSIPIGLAGIGDVPEYVGQLARMTFEVFARGVAVRVPGFDGRRTDGRIWIVAVIGAIEFENVTVDQPAKYLSTSLQEARDYGTYAFGHTSCNTAEYALASSKHLNSASVAAAADALYSSRD